MGEWEDVETMGKRPLSSQERVRVRSLLGTAPLLMGEG